MCGTYHAMMNFEIRVVSAEDFARYIALRENQGLTNAAALEAICQVPVSVTTVPFETRRAMADTPKHPRRHLEYQTAQLHAAIDGRSKDEDRSPNLRAADRVLPDRCGRLHGAHRHSSSKVLSGPVRRRSTSRVA